MAGAESRIEDNLYEGESVQHRLEIGETRVVVTDKRVFASKPDTGAVRHAERLNVADVEPSTTGSSWTLQVGLSLVVVALPLVVAGVFVRRQFDSFALPGFDQSAADRIGAGGLTDLVGLMVYLAENLDLVLFAVGAVLFSLAALCMGWYFTRARTPTLAIRTAGEAADIHIPRKNAPADARARLERAILGRTGEGPAESVGDGSAAGTGTGEALPGTGDEQFESEAGDDTPPELDEQEKRALPEPDDAGDGENEDSTGGPDLF